MGGLPDPPPRFPEQRLAIIVLGNVSGFDAGGMARRIADIYLADVLARGEDRESSSSVREEVDVERELLKDYVGSYKLGPGWLLTITRDGDSLMAQATNEPRFSMAAMSETVFWVEAWRRCSFGVTRRATSRVSSIAASRRRVSSWWSRSRSGWRSTWVDSTARSWTPATQSSSMKVA